MPKFDSSRWKTLSAQFDQALELDAAARTVWLDRLAAGDAPAAAILRRMLARVGVESTWNDSTPNASFGDLLREALTDESAVEPLGYSIGAWVTRSVLGSGGMGTVYLAERALDGGTQRGALKLIRRGMDSNEILARFRRERQILIRLAHPSIAPLLDGGVSADGRPYLVMGYIDGVPLDQWSTRADIDLEARCRVILQLCDAVAHAHRLLIVHRDIKPSNVLVDADNRPHLLDFGIAKMLEDTADAHKTATVARVFTRAYSAPEQARGESVGTAVDIYQIGVLLFELLTGVRFHGNPDATTSSPTQRLAIARGRAGKAGPTAISARALRGDAGVIVTRATDANPVRRYATVEALAEDVRRWRSGRPILARADSAGYRVRRFVGRNKTLVAAALFAVVAMLGGASIALWQARQAREHAQRADAEAASAKASLQFLLNAFVKAEPWNNGGKMPTALDLADDAFRRADTELIDQPSARADMYHALARMYSTVGDVGKASIASEKAVAALKSLPSVDNARLYDAELRLAYSYTYLPDFRKLKQTVDRLVATYGGNADRDYLTDTAFGGLLKAQGRYTEQLAQLMDGLSYLYAHGRGSETGETWWHAYVVQRALGRFPAAIAAEHNSRQTHMAHLKADSAGRPNMLYTAWQLAADLDAPQDAAAQMRAQVVRNYQIFGDSLYTADALFVYAQTVRRTVGSGQALPLLRAAERMASTGSGGTAYDAIPQRSELADALIDLGLAHQARELIDSTIATLASYVDDAAPRQWYLRALRARTEPDAAAALRAAWDDKERPPELRERVDVLRWLAEAEAQAGRKDAARARWQELLAELDRQGRPLGLDAWRAHTALAAGGDTDATRHRTDACAMAAILFAPGATQSASCPTPDPLDLARWPRPMRDQIPDLIDAAKRLDQAKPLDQAALRWLDEIAQP